MSRYVVTGIEGSLGGDSAPGLSVQVLDTVSAHRCVFAHRTEDYGRNTQRTQDFVRYEAERVAARMNGEPPPPPFNRWRARFRPTCPTCGSLTHPDAAYCSCGKNLYRRERGH